MYSSVKFYKLIQLHNHYHEQDTEYFLTPESSLCPFVVNPFRHHQLLTTTDLPQLFILEIFKLIEKCKNLTMNHGSPSTHILHLSALGPVCILGLYPSVCMISAELFVSCRCPDALP